MGMVTVGVQTEPALYEPRNVYVSQLGITDYYVTYRATEAIALSF